MWDIHRSFQTASMTNQETYPHDTPRDPWTPPDAELAGFWPRLGAAALDAVLYGLIAVPFFLIGGITLFTQTDCVTSVCDDLEFTGNPGIAFLGGTLMALGSLVAFVVYLHALATSGRPWGSRIVGLQVVGSDAAPIGWLRALLRCFVAGGGSGTCAVSYLWMLGNRERQTWHDKIARSFVIRDER